MRVPIARHARAGRFTRAVLLAILLLALPAAASAAPKPRLMSIAVSPTSDYVPQGVTMQLRVVATYSDGSTADVTQSARWSSSNDAVASVAGRAVVTHTMGTATITARWKNLVGTATVTVADTLTRIDVEPQFLFVEFVGVPVTVLFTATGYPLTGPTVDVTPYAEWSSSNPLVVRVDASGVATCLGLGGAGISALLDPVTSSSGGGSVTCGSPPA